jgi:hypothetical protein
MELAHDNCLVKGNGSLGSGPEPTLAARIEDLRLSLRFCSSCKSRMASSIDEVMDNFSAVASSCAILLVCELDRVLTPGEGWTRVTLFVEAVRRMGVGLMILVCCRSGWGLLLFSLAEDSFDVQVGSRMWSWIGFWSAASPGLVVSLR